MNGSICNSRGDCIGNDTYSYCNCTVEGWIGIGCELVNDSYCPNNCSGFTCVLNNIPFCDCIGATGKDCSEKIELNNNASIPIWEIVIIIIAASVAFLVIILFIIVLAFPSVRYKIFPSKKIRKDIKSRTMNQNPNINNTNSNPNLNSNAPPNIKS